MMWTHGALEPVETATGVTRRVPQDYPNIQTAVDAAAPSSREFSQPSGSAGRLGVPARPR